MCITNVAEKDLVRLIPNIRHLVAPILDLAFKKQASLGSINLQKVQSSCNGLCHSAVTVNAETAEFHTENDCTYTLITVPKQEYKLSIKNKRQYSFVYKLKIKENVSIRLTPGLTFLFSGKMLTHRQTCNMLCLPKVEPFINFASYGSQKLFNHIRCSFLRNNTN